MKEFMKDSSKVIIAVGLGITFAVALSAPMILSGYSGGTIVQGGQLFGGMMSMMATQGQTITETQAVQMMKSIPGYANVMPVNDTIVFNSKDIKLVVLATDLEGAANLTTNAPPSYATDNVFVIYGLVNPTLVVPRGATLQVTFVNLDSDMYHNFAMASLSPPYPYMAMQGMMYWQQRPWMAMAPFLPPANYRQGLVHEYSYTVTLGNQGSLWYLCTYPGHAQAGMFGKVLAS
ncbi:MAG TPA: hypothetical protein VGR53_10965 [Nitrososphaerales archaeon]|nr:hypothetical protein [Nitrososphaerales archaeon]